MERERSREGEGEGQGGGGGGQGGQGHGHHLLRLIDAQRLELRVVKLRRRGMDKEEELVRQRQYKNPGIRAEDVLRDSEAQIDGDRWG